MAFEIEHLGGRLVGVVMASPMTVDDILTGAKKIRAILGVSPGQQFLFATDVRELGVIPSEVQDAITKMMESDNPQVAFNGLWGNRRSQSSLTAFRLIHQVGNPNRQVFLSHHELFAALQPRLTNVELMSLQQFINKRLKAATSTP